MRRALPCPTLLRAFLWVLLGACGTEAPPAPPAPVAEELASLAGPVVATVDGTAITLGEVEDVVRRTGLGPREALTRLEEELVLAHAAGVPDEAVRRDADRVARRAAVQALLRHDVEERFRPETVPDDIVRARLEHDAAMFAQPERRASVHVLCRPNRDAPPEGEAAAERFCRDVLEAVVAASDPRAAAEAYAGTDTTGRTFTVTVETVRPARRDGELAEEYAAALFSLPAPGAVPDLVHTRFGWHVIVLTEVVPPWSIPAEEAERVVRRQLAVEARAAALDALARELLARTEVVLDPRGLDLAMRAPLEGSVDGAAGAVPMGTALP